MPTVYVYGPNLQDQTGGTFKVRVNRTWIRELGGARALPMVLQVESRQEVVEEVYGDQIAEADPEEWGTDKVDWENFEVEFEWSDRVVDLLPRERPAATTRDEPNEPEPQHLLHNEGPPPSNSELLDMAGALLRVACQLIERANPRNPI